jgi:selenocysteine-specific translation elongation factor
VTVTRALTAAVLTDLDLAGKVAKRGSETDLTIFDRKKGDFVLSLLVPHRYPEKLMPLLIALAGADAAVVSVGELTRALGDAIVAVEAFRPPSVAVYLPGAVSRDQLQPLLRGTLLERAPTFDTHHALSDFLGDEARAPRPAQGTAVMVDQSFEVKGVGTVVLGKVHAGPVRVNQKLTALPAGAETSVRSIQIHDDDHDTGPAGVRVGLALRGATVDDVPRGTVLASGALTPTVEVVEGPFRPNAFFKPPPSVGAVVHVASGFGSSPGRVAAADGATLRVELEKPLVRLEGLPAVVASLDAPGSRIVGWFS